MPARTRRGPTGKGRWGRGGWVSVAVKLRRASGGVGVNRVVGGVNRVEVRARVDLGLASLGLLDDISLHTVNELFIHTQPAHLQKRYSEKLSAEERDLLRADMLRERLRVVSRPNTNNVGTDLSKLDKPSEQ